MLRGLWSIVCLLGLVPSLAVAQWDPEAGDVGNWNPPPPAEGQQQQSGQQQPGGWYNNQPGDNERPPGMGGNEEPGSSRSRSSGDSDHSQVVGSVGIGFFGVDSIPIDPRTQVADGEPPTVVLDAPAIGIRAWFSDKIGLDAALGFGFTDFSFTRDGSVTTGLQGAFGINVHLGLPIALHSFDHFTVELIPEIDFAYGKATLLALRPANDIDLNGMEFNITLRLGGEIQFGFIGLPQLGLQATIGMGVNYFNRSANGNFGAIDSDDETPATRFDLGQSGIRVQSTLNNIFEGTIRIVYYLN